MMYALTFHDMMMYDMILNDISISLSRRGDQGDSERRRYAERHELLHELARYGSIQSDGGNDDDDDDDGTDDDDDDDDDENIIDG